MKSMALLSLLLSLALSACTWQTNRALLADDPDDKVVHTGSHIPVKEKATTVSSGDADAMMRSQRALGTAGGTSGGATGR